MKNLKFAILMIGLSVTVFGQTVYGQQKCSTGESKFYVTGLYHTAALNDTTLPPIEVCGKSRLDAFTRIGAAVWTEAEWQRVSAMRAERDRLIRAIEGKPERAHAPQKPSEPKPEAKPVVLSLEASKVFMDIEQEKAALRERYGEAVKRQDALMVGAQLSPEQRQSVRAWDGQGKPPWTVEGQQVIIPTIEKPKP